MGDIFILPGNLSLIDVGMFANVWEVVANQAKAQARAAQDKRSSNHGHQRRDKRGNFSQPPLHNLLRLTRMQNGVCVCSVR